MFAENSGLKATILNSQRCLMTATSLPEMLDQTATFVGVDQKNKVVYVLRFSINLYYPKSDVVEENRIKMIYLI